MADEEVVEDEGQPVEEQGAAYSADPFAKPKSDVYTAILVLAFVAFAAGIVLAGRELWEAYDVQFFVFKK